MYKLLTHNDLDGVGCGVLAKLAFGNDVYVRYNSISSLNEEVKRYLADESQHDNKLFITDLAVNEENETALQDFYAKGGKVQLIDHHKTSEHLMQYDWVTIQVTDEQGNGTSATSMFYEELIRQGHLSKQDALDEFVELVRLYDTWEWEKQKNEKAKRLNALLFLQTIDEFAEEMITRLTASRKFEFSDIENKLLHVQDAQTARYIRKKKRQVIAVPYEGYLAGVVHAESYLSELGNELGKAFSHLDFVVMIMMGTKRLSFRTIHDDVDVSALAGKFGGGGHQKASGASLTAEAYQIFVNDAFDAVPLREDAQDNQFNLPEADPGVLYENEQKDKFLIVMRNHKWYVLRNQQHTDEVFDSCEAAIRFVKREHAAYLVNDRRFVRYFIERAKKKDLQLENLEKIKRQDA